MIYEHISSTYASHGVRIAPSIYKEPYHLQVTILGCLMEGGITSLYKYIIYKEYIHKNLRIMKKVKIIVQHLQNYYYENTKSYYF
jgi:hypothetical protein